MKFVITKNQELKYKEWIKDHSKSTDTLGIHYKWEFIPNSIGLSVRVENLLTEEFIDLSEYDKW